MPGKCNCDYPEVKYNSWTGHAHNCPIEKAARRGTYPRCKENPVSPSNLPRWLKKVLAKEGVNG